SAVDDLSASSPDPIVRERLMDGLMMMWPDRPSPSSSSLTCREREVHIPVRMKITETIDLLANGSIPTSPEWKKACADVEAAIKATDWPHGSGTFILYPESGKK